MKNKQMKQTSVYLEPELHKKIKIQSIEEGIKMNDLIVKSLKLYLGNIEKKNEEEIAINNEISLDIKELLDEIIYLEKSEVIDDLLRDENDEIIWNK